MEITIDNHKSIFECSIEELNEVRAITKQAWGVVQQREVLTFHPGKKVSFVHKRQKIYGEVTKTNQKSVSVKTDDGHNWNVSPGLLTLEV